SLPRADCEDHRDSSTTPEASLRSVSGFAHYDRGGFCHGERSRCPEERGASAKSNHPYPEQTAKIIGIVGLRRRPRCARSPASLTMTEEVFVMVSVADVPRNEGHPRSRTIPTPSRLRRS